jgi:CBS domain-containing protein
VVTDRDIAVRVIAERRDPERVRLAEVMSPRPVFLAQTAEIRWALQLMSDLAVRRIPVVDERHELVGLVSLDDVILAVAGELGAVAETIRKEM